MNNSGTGPGIDFTWDTAAKTHTGEDAFPQGTYTVGARSKLNNMDNNYLSGSAACTGRTVSGSKTITIVRRNVLRDEIGIYLPSTGNWYFDNNLDGKVVKNPSDTVIVATR